ncbi:MAG: metal-dependent hydrolase [Thermoplasmata archaeon]
MDPFSHLLLAYPVTFGVFGSNGLPYVVAGAIAGGLPDGDVIFFPISRRFPLLRHRGISHSIVGVTVIAAVGAAVMPRLLVGAFGASFAGGSPILYLVAMEIGGSTHVLLDALDHWSVPVFAPFSKQEYHFDADRIFDLGAMVFTVVAYAALLYERGREPVWVWDATSWVLLALASVYIGVRLLARWRAGVAAKREGFPDVIPQVNPLVFLLVDERTGEQGLSIRYAQYHLRRGFLAPAKRHSIPPGPPDSGPVRDETDALQRSYGASVKASWVLGETHHFGEARKRPGGFEVHWYSLEMVVFGRAGGVLATVDGATGRVDSETCWKAPGTFTG